MFQIYNHGPGQIYIVVLASTILSISATPNLFINIDLGDPQLVDERYTYADARCQVQSGNNDEFESGRGVVEDALV